MKLPEIIGLPPLDDFSGLDAKMGSPIAFAKKVFPMLQLYPKIQTTGPGLNIYKLNSGMEQYINILKHSGGFEPFNKGIPLINICFQHTNQFSETYNNQYGQGLLASITNPLSSAMLEGQQMLGDAPGKLYDKASGMISKLMGSGNMDKVKGFLGDKGSKQMSNLVKQIATGGKFNFPQFWKSSSFDVNYDIHIKLYNLNPSDEASHQKYIVGPLVALLAFVNPRSKDGQTFKWPLMCEVKAPGLFHIKTGYVKTISVTKGGDSNSVAWNMRPSIVDVRMSFGTVYNVKSATENEVVNKFLPTILDDAQILSTIKGVNERTPPTFQSSANLGRDTANDYPNIEQQDASNYHSNADITTGKSELDNATTESLNEEGFNIKKYISKLGVTSQNLYSYTKNLAQKVQDGTNKVKDLTTRVKNGVALGESIKSKFSQHTTSGNIAGVQGILSAMGGMDNNLGAIASNLNSSISHTGNMVTQISDTVEATGAGKYVSALDSISEAKVAVQHSTTNVREAIPISTDVKNSSAAVIEDAKDIRDPSNPEFNDSMTILEDNLTVINEDATNLESNLMDLNTSHNDNAEYIDTFKNDLESIVSSD